MSTGTEVLAKPGRADRYCYPGLKRENPFDGINVVIHEFAQCSTWSGGEVDSYPPCLLTFPQTTGSGPSSPLTGLISAPASTAAKTLPSIPTRRKIRESSLQSWVEAFFETLPLKSRISGRLPAAFPLLRTRPAEREAQFSRSTRPPPPNLL